MTAAAAVQPPAHAGERTLSGTVPGGISCDVGSRPGDVRREMSVVASGTDAHTLTHSHTALDGHRMAHSTGCRDVGLLPPLVYCNATFSRYEHTHAYTALGGHCMPRCRSVWWLPPLATVLPRLHDYTVHGWAAAAMRSAAEPHGRSLLQQQGALRASAGLPMQEMQASLIFTRRVFRRCKFTMKCTRSATTDASMLSQRVECTTACVPLMARTVLISGLHDSVQLARALRRLLQQPRPLLQRTRTHFRPPPVSSARNSVAIGHAHARTHTRPQSHARARARSHT